MNMTNYTTEDINEYVGINLFRIRIDYLITKVTVDRHSCTNPDEIATWRDNCRYLARELAATGCKRAKKHDWDKRESALDMAAKAIIRSMQAATMTKIKPVWHAGKIKWVVTYNGTTWGTRFATRADAEKQIERVTGARRYTGLIPGE